MLFAPSSSARVFIDIQSRVHSIQPDTRQSMPTPDEAHRAVLGAFLRQACLGLFPGETCTVSCRLATRFVGILEVVPDKWIGFGFAESSIQ